MIQHKIIYDSERGLENKTKKRLLEMVTEEDVELIHGGFKVTMLSCDFVCIDWYHPPGSKYERITLSGYDQESINRVKGRILN